MKKLRPVFKTHGGKFYLAKWIIENFPEDYREMTYCEPYVGGGSVFLNKEPSQTEVINDLDKKVVSVFKALRDEPGEIIGRIKRTKYKEETFKKALKDGADGFTDYIDEAVNEVIVRRMSRGGMKSAFSWSNRKRGGQPGDLNAWETYKEQLAAIADRVHNAHIFNEKAEEIIRVWDGPNTLMYLDPPYLPSTRTSPNVYENEMSIDDHIHLSEIINNAKSYMILSGYPSALYNRLYKDWNCLKKEIVNHSSQKSKKDRKIECIWLNF